MDIEKAVKQIIHEKIEAMTDGDMHCEKCEEVHVGRQYKLGDTFPVVLCLNHLREYVIFAANSDWWWDYKLAMASFDKAPTRENTDWYAAQEKCFIAHVEGWLINGE
jgi:hypothetical protein